MPAVDMKSTEYYKSGKHLENVLSARLKAIESQMKNKEVRVRQYYENPSLCQNCGCELSYDKRHCKFCSKSCSAKMSNRKRTESGWKHSEESRVKISDSVKEQLSTVSAEEKAHRKQNQLENPGAIRQRSPDVVLCCKICLKEFVESFCNRHKKTCGNKDCIVQASIGQRTYQNGSRKPVWFFNPFENKEVLLESSWEVDVATFLIDADIKWIRPKFIKWTDSTGKTRRYFPDFYLPDHNLYVDPKNPYCMERDKEKMNAVGGIVDLIFGDVEYIKQYIRPLQA